MSNLDNRPVFFLSEASDGKPFIILGIPRGAMNALERGMGHDFDLTSAGVPVRITVMYGKDHQDVLNQIEDVAKQANIPILDERRKDFSIK